MILYLLRGYPTLKFWFIVERTIWYIWWQSLHLLYEFWPEGLHEPHSGREKGWKSWDVLGSFQLNTCFMTPCLIFFLRIIYFLQINLDSDQEILASINFFSINREILSAFDMGLEFRGMMDWFLSCVKMVFPVKWLIF